MLKKQQSRPIYLQVTLIAGFTFIVIILFALARSIYRDSFQVGRYIDNSLSLIESGKNTALSEKEELTYAETPQYQEKIAKELLGFKMPGEEVIILATEEQNIDALLPDKALRQRQRERKLLTNPQKWWRYLFGF